MQRAVPVISSAEKKKPEYQYATSVFLKTGII